MKKIKIGLLIILGLIAFGKSVGAQTKQVVIYSDTNFQGSNTSLNQSWKGGGAFDRNIKSIKIPAGFRVRIYEGKDFKGVESLLTEDWNPGQGAYWHGRIRSISIDRAQILPPVKPLPPTTPPTVEDFPVIYAGTNFDGAAEAVERDKANLADWDGSPHTIRSIRVPKGWFFVLYKKRNFRGKSYNVNSNITFAPGDEWYNKIRSIKVYQGTPPKQPR